MRRITFVLLLMFFSVFTSLSSFAQAGSYTFSHEIGTYSEITGGTSVSIISDDVISAFQNIGFTFNYSGVNYTQFKMSSNGFISFGTGTATLNTNSFTTANTTSRPIIAPLWDDLAGATVSNSEASYIVTGTAPNRVLTIQWKNWEWRYIATTPVISFQVKLYETTNVIEFVYKQELGAVETGSASIGIGGISVTTDFLNLTNVNVPAVSNSVNVTDIATKPATGQIFRFTPPTCLPPSQFTSSNLTSSGVDFTFITSTTPATLGYIYELRTDLNPGTPGAVSTGNITNNQLNISLSNLQPSTTYNLFVKALCSSSDESSWSAVQTFTTLCAVLDAPTVVETFSGFTGSITTTSLPCWLERTGATIGGTLSGTTSAWTNANYNNVVTPFGTAAYLNLYGTKNEWLISPSIDLGSSTGPNYMLTYNPLIIPYSGTSQLTNMGADKSVTVLISTDNGNTWDTANILKVYDNNNIPNEVYYKEFINLSAYSGIVKFAFFAKSSSTTIDTRFYIDNFQVELMPSCFFVGPINTTSVTKNSVIVNFEHYSGTLGSNTTLGYQYEIRTSGLPGSGTEGLVATNLLAADAVSFNISNLSPSTEYFVYLRRKCSEQSYSEWISTNFITLCDSPDFISSTPGVRCGVGTVNLSATYTAGEVKWFSALEGGSVLHTGSTFTTPEINETTSYYVSVGQATSVFANITLGSGNVVSSTYSNPLYSLWSNIHTQHIITAAELLDYGVAPGPINSLALDVTSAGTLPMIDLSIKIGTSQMTSLNTFDVNANLTPVYTSASYMPTLGVNVFQFTQPYIWDGQSNIIIEFCHGNPSSTATMSRTIKMENTNYVSTIKTNLTSATSSATICEDTTSNILTYSSRPQFIFNAYEYCKSERREVIATVNTAPELTLSTSGFQICANETELVTIVSGADQYDTYVWNPSTGVTGNATNGWVFSVTENTLYTLTASQSSGDLCVTKNSINVTVTPIPSSLDLEDSYTLCSNEIIELKVGDNELWVLNEVFGFEDAEDLGFVHNSVSTTLESTNVYFSQGTSAIKFSHTANAQGTFTQIQPLNLLGYQNPYVEFSHIAGLESCCDFGYVEYSTDGGITWVPFKPSNYVGLAQAAGSTEVLGQRFTRSSYTDWNTTLSSSTSLPNNSLWKTERFNIPTDIDLSNFSIRFRLSSDGSVNYTGWYIDNVKILGNSTPYVIWSPATNLYLDAAATQPYPDGLDVPVVYFKSSVGMDSTNYTATLSNDFACEVLQTTSILVNHANDPIYEVQEFCGFVNVSDIVLGDLQQGGIIRWYTSLDSPLPITSINQSGTYYVSQDYMNCRSSRVPANVIIRPILQSPAANANQLFCDSATVADLHAIASVGGEIGWFASIDANVPLSSSTVLTTNVYYVAQFNGYCWSEKVPVNVTVNPVPSAPNNATQHLCGVYTLSQISLGQANNAILRWYASENSVQPLSLATTVVTGTYYVSQIVGSCESVRVPINFVAYEAVNSPIAQTQNFCGSATVADLVAQGLQGAELIWYSSSVSTTPLSPNTPLSNGTYYVVQSINGCVSSRKAVVVRVISMTPPTVAPFIICGSGTVADLHIPSTNSVSYKWYLSPTSLQELPQTTELANGVYYVSRFQNGCETPRTPVTVALSPIPAAPTGQEIQSFVQGATVSHLQLDQINVLWFETYNESQTSSVALGLNRELENGKTYYAVIVSPEGCRSLPFAVTVQVYLSSEGFDKESLKYYPNPVDDVLNISYAEKIIKFTIYDLLGKQVKSILTDDNDLQIDLSDLAAGTYLVQLKTDTKEQYIKIVKK